MIKNRSSLLIFICVITIMLLVGCFINNEYLSENKEVASKIIEDSNFENEIIENIQEDIEKGVKKEIIKEKIIDEEAISKLKEIKEDPLFILVNKNNLLHISYEPIDLVFSEIEFLDYIETRYLNGYVATAAKEMFEAALEDEIILIGASGYRSYDFQEVLFNSRAEEIGVERTSEYTAPPGASEHQTGLALDIVGEDYQNLDTGFQESESFRWLMNNCYKYGFILRYIYGKEDITGFCYEPWHFRYIGNAEVAEEIMNRNIAFEEYLDELDNKIKELENKA